MIKLFEEYNEYYTEIDGYYFNDLINTSNHIINFETSEINFLKKKYFEYDFSLHVFIYDIKYIQMVIKDPYEKDIYVYIIKLPDEWYLVQIGRYASVMDYEYFKCDQWVGLLKFLEDRI